MLILWPAQSFYFGLSGLVKRLGLSVALGVLAGWESILEKLFLSESLCVRGVVLQCSGRRISCASRRITGSFAVTLHHYCSGHKNHHSCHPQDGPSHTHHFWQPFGADIILHSAPKTPVVLGCSWLHCHNPQID